MSAGTKVFPKMAYKGYNNGYGKGKGGNGKGYGKGSFGNNSNNYYQNSQFVTTNSNGYNNQYWANQNSQNQSSDDPYRLCFKCGLCTHDAGSCPNDYDSRKWGIIRNAAWEGKKAMIDESRQSDFFARTFKATPKAAQLDTALPDNSHFPVLLTGITPDVRIEAITQLGNLFSGFIKAVPYTQPGSIFVFVTCVLFYESEKEAKKAAKALAHYEINDKTVFASTTTRRIAKKIAKGIGKGKVPKPVSNESIIVRRNKDGSRSKIGAKGKEDSSDSSSESSSSSSSSSTTSSSSSNSSMDGKKAKKDKKKKKKRKAKQAKDSDKTAPVSRKGKERMEDKPSTKQPKYMDVDSEENPLSLCTNDSDIMVQAIKQHDTDIKGLYSQVRDTRDDINKVSNRLEKHIDSLPSLLDNTSNKMLSSLTKLLKIESWVPPSSGGILIQDSPNPGDKRGKKANLEDEYNVVDEDVPDSMQEDDKEDPIRDPYSDGDGETDEEGIKELVPPKQQSARKAKEKDANVVATVPAKKSKVNKNAQYTPPRAVPNLIDNGPSSHIPSSSGRASSTETPTVGPVIDPSKRLSFSFTPPLIMPGIRIPDNGPIKQFTPGQKVTFTTVPDRSARVECGIILKEVPKDLSYMVMKMEPRHLYRFTHPNAELVANAFPVPHYLIEAVHETMDVDELVQMLSIMNRRKVNASRIAAKGNGRISPIQRNDS